MLFPETKKAMVVSIGKQDLIRAEHGLLEGPGRGHKRLGKENGERGEVKNTTGRLKKE